jgi:hypothetical protein
MKYIVNVSEKKMFERIPNYFANRT